MNWKEVLLQIDTHSEYAVEDLERGLNVDFMAEDLQKLVDAAIAAERERWTQERKDYRSLLMQARLVLRGPHTEQNIVVRELVARIEARGVQFGA